MTKRKFYRTFIILEVLSEDPVGDRSLGDILYEMDEGSFSGGFLGKSENEVGGDEMALLLQSQGSDPEFFQLDEKGNDIEDEEED